MTNKCGSVRIAMEAILLLIYVWNSALILGTNLSRSFVAVGRKFQFPIDFSADKHWELTSAPPTIKLYAKELTAHLQASCKVAKILVEEQCAMHGEFINAHLPDPKVYSVNNIVFARCSIRSDSSRGWVDKLSYPFTGPWRIVASLQNAS